MANGDRLSQIVADPDFQSLPLAGQQSFLSEVDPDFGKLSTGEFSTFLARVKGQRAAPPDALAQAKAALPQPKPMASLGLWGPTPGEVTGNMRPPGDGEEATLAEGALPGASLFATLGAPGYAAASAVGGAAAKKGAQALGAGPKTQTAAEIVGGLAGGGIYGGVKSLLPNAERAATNLRAVKTAVANTPMPLQVSNAGLHTMDLGEVADVALRAKQLQQAGGQRAHDIKVRPVPVWRPSNPRIFR